MPEVTTGEPAWNESRNGGDVAARLLAPISDSFPMQHGMLRVSAASIHSESPNEAFDVVVSGRGELSAVLLELRAQRPAVGVYDALSRIRRALVDGVPIYELLLLLKTWCLAPERHAVLGIALLRFSQSDSRVEILNAGLPAIASALPGGRIALHPALSGAIGAREKRKCVRMNFCHSSGGAPGFRCPTRSSPRRTPKRRGVA